MRTGVSSRSLVLSLAAVAVLGSVAPAMAQGEAQQPAASDVSGVAQATEEVQIDPNLYVGLQEAHQHHTALRKPEVRPQDLKTIFFTLWQHRLLEEQRRYGVQTRGATEQEMQATGPAPENRVRGIRELSLGGIVYASGKNWVVWLNGQRVTPEAIPREVIDIQVKDDYIELKWYDSWTNLIFPIRLRPHQRFNLDTRIFLPGTAAL